MEVQLPLLYISLILLIFSYLLISQLRWKSPNLPPTVFPTLPIIGHLYLLKPPLYRTLAKLSTKFGPILHLRFGSRGVMLKNASPKTTSTLPTAPSLCMERSWATTGRASCGGEREDKNTMIDMLLSLQESDSKYYNDEMIQSFLMVYLLAGTDTTAGTMEWAMTLLLNNPNTLRMYPAGPLLVPRESSKDCVVGGYNIPGGTMLLVNQWAIHRDPKLWTNPKTYNPERFEGLEAMRDGSCPGEGLAVRVMALSLGILIQCFNWERVSEKMVDMTEGRGLNLPKAKPLIAKCKARLEILSLLAQ
ncbi:hypothetical protein QVD17_16168 [Tagetes erecta]|uniref:Cytochrome P450 n=1 Tax=Tagetes erecta TaxID=13708 RepID=A0AAD8KWA4_TARER|nr:hypothetical protein QVD17_16168 [Tagetes erecta]